MNTDIMYSINKVIVLMINKRLRENFYVNGGFFVIEVFPLNFVLFKP